MGRIRFVRRKLASLAASVGLAALTFLVPGMAGAADSVDGAGAGAAPAESAATSRTAGGGQSGDGTAAAPGAQAARKKGAQRKTRGKGKRIREKDAEGTEALDRFQADTVIKSKYELNGEPLEVDPD